jgi:hypothetical protein
MNRILAQPMNRRYHSFGTSGRFYHRFDAIVPLTAPANILLSRVETRTTNPYGKTAAQQEFVLCTADSSPRDRVHVGLTEALRRIACGGGAHDILVTRPRTA